MLSKKVDSLHLRKAEETNQADHEPKEVHESSSQDNVEWGSTEHLSERRYKNMQRDVKRGKRFVTIAGEERGYSDESTNEFADHNNEFYDSRLLPAQKRSLAEWQWKIKQIKRNHLPQEFKDIRAKCLRESEEKRVKKNGAVPAWLHDVTPPWDQGIGLAITRYNETIITNINRSIDELREQNAALCAQEDAANKKHGPRDGQGRR